MQTKYAEERLEVELMWCCTRMKRARAIDGINSSDAIAGTTSIITKKASFKHGKRFLHASASESIGCVPIADVHAKTITVPDVIKQATMLSFRTKVPNK
jgi:hypothetical protein